MQIQTAAPSQPPIAVIETALARLRSEDGPLSHLTSPKTTTPEEASSALAILTCVAKIHQTALALDGCRQFGPPASPGAIAGRLPTQDRLDAQALKGLVMALTTDPKRGITARCLAAPVLAELRATTLYEEIADRHGLTALLADLTAALETYECLA